MVKVKETEAQIDVELKVLQVKESQMIRIHALNSLSLDGVLFPFFSDSITVRFCIRTPITWHSFPPSKLWR